jgi:hypothetical protein
MRRGSIALAAAVVGALLAGCSGDAPDGDGDGGSDLAAGTGDGGGGGGGGADLSAERDDLAGLDLAGLDLARSPLDLATPSPGTVWREVSPIPALGDLHGVWARGLDEAWVVGDSGAIAWTTDRGGSWTVAHPTTKTLRAIWGVADELFAVGDDGVVVRGTRGGAGGASFSVAATDPTPRRFVALSGRSIADVFGGGEGAATVIRDAPSWTFATIGGLTTIGGVFVDGAGTLYIDGLADADGGSAPVVLSSTTRGLTWSVQGRFAGGATARAGAIWGSASNDLWAIVGDTVVQRWDGAMWKPSGPTTFTPTPLRAIHGSSRFDVYLAGDGGAIYHSDDVGLTWAIDTSQTTVALHGVFSVGARAWAVGAGGTVLTKP